MKRTKLVLSCEHGGNNVPREYEALFKHNRAILKTHRAQDFGALKITQAIAQHFDCDYVYTTNTRLLIDCNRSLNHKTCFSEFSHALSQTEKEILIKNLYLPYRQKIGNIINHHINQGLQVLHLSLHTFTPELDGKTRNAAIGLLYNPSRHAEKEVARIWKNLLIHHPVAYRVRLNYPYLGKSDGLTQTLRKQYPSEDYLGFELECNQELVHNPKMLASLYQSLITSLSELLGLL